MAEHPIGFGIVGAGVAARYHAQAIAQTPGARLAALCASDPARAAEVSAAFGAPCEPDLDALLARPDVDAVCLCTPSGQHAAQGIAAARTGRHVLVEKPIALSLADADALIGACRDARVRLGVALQRRADPTFQAIARAVADGELGRLVLGSVSVPYLRGESYYAQAPWRGTWALDGGGVLMNQGIHLVDLLLWLMGDVAEVHARAATLVRSVEVEDTLAATLRFAGGALGTITATTAAAPGFPHRVEVYGDQGGVQIEGEQVLRWPGRGEQGAAADAGSGASPTGISAIGHTRIVADFVAAVRDGREPLVPGAEARRSLAVVLAAYESARSGAPVQVAS